MCFGKRDGLERDEDLADYLTAVLDEKDKVIKQQNDSIIQLSERERELKEIL